MRDEHRMRDERRKQIIDVWKTIVGVQQHFNDISMRIRSMFVTILLALFASIGFLLDRKVNLEIGTITIQFPMVVPLFGIFGTCLFYFIDRYWYHRLLVGAVKHAISIESKYKNEMPELSLSAAIGAESPYEPRGVVRWSANLIVSDPRYRDSKRLHSDGKIELFYKSVVVVLLLTTVIIGCLGGIGVNREEAPATAPHSSSSAIPAQPRPGSPTAAVSPQGTETQPPVTLEKKNP